MIARRQAIDLRRRTSSRPLLALDDARLSENGGAAAIDGEAERLAAGLDLRHALARLPAPQRAVLELCYIGQLRQTEIAQCLGIPIGTVKSRSYSGLKALKIALEEQDHHE